MVFFIITDTNQGAHPIKNHPNGHVSWPHTTNVKVQETSELPLEATLLWFNNPANVVRVLIEGERICSSIVTVSAHVTRAGRGDSLPTPLHVFSLSFNLIIPTFHFISCVWLLSANSLCTLEHLTCPCRLTIYHWVFEETVVFKMTYGEIRPRWFWRVQMRHP